MTSKIDIIVTEVCYRYRKSLIAELETCGRFAIREAENGIELLELMRKHVATIVIFDLEMPVLNGSTTLNLIKEGFPNTKAIILSHFDDIALMENFIHRGVHGYIPKSFISNDVSVLVDGIMEVSLGRKFYYSFDTKNINVKYTKRETDIIPHIIQGKLSKEIAVIFNLSTKRVNNLRYSIYKKNNVHNIAEFVNVAKKKGLFFIGTK